MCRFELTRTVATFVVLALALPALADPPSHAPAHGWRKKHDPYYQGYTGHKWNDDYGVMEGRCDAQRIGTTLGGQAGADIGAAVGGETGAIIGSVAGVLIGAKIDEKIDRVDRGCVSHALDVGEEGRPVQWTNPRTHERYEVVPGAVVERDGRVCRSFSWAGGVQQLACVTADGSWTVR